MQKSRLHFVLTFIWIAITVALASWWLVFIMNGVDTWVQNPPSLEQSLYYKEMMKQEGTFLIIMLLSGGFALLYLVWGIENEKERVKTFFAFFTHDLKTSLTRLRLQTELIEEVEDKDELKSRIQHVQEEVMGLQVQLENALWMSRDFNLQTIFERRKWLTFIENLKMDWPGLNIICKSQNSNNDWLEQLTLDIDRRLFQNIFQNLIQNAWIHGEATEIIMDVNLKNENLEIFLSDNGKGFIGDINKIGKLFSRTTPTSGTGIGLHVVQESVRKLNGEVHFAKLSLNKFECHLIIPQYQNINSGVPNGR